MVPSNLMELIYEHVDGIPDDTRDEVISEVWLYCHTISNWNRITDISRYVRNLVGKKYVSVTRFNIGVELFSDPEETRELLEVCGVNITDLTECLDKLEEEDREFLAIVLNSDNQKEALASLGMYRRDFIKKFHSLRYRITSLIGGIE